MSAKDNREVWLRGPLPGIPSLLQPVAHALLQAREEVKTLMNDFPEEKLWEKPAGVASPGFHLQHLSEYWIDCLLMQEVSYFLNCSCNLRQRKGSQQKMLQKLC